MVPPMLEASHFCLPAPEMSQMASGQHVGSKVTDEDFSLLGPPNWMLVRRPQKYLWAASPPRVLSILLFSASKGLRSSPGVPLLTVLRRSAAKGLPWSQLVQPGVKPVVDFRMAST